MTEFRHHLSIRVNSETHRRLNKHFENWGDKASFFVPLIEMLLDELDKDSSLVIMGVKRRKAKLKFEFEKNFLNSIKNVE